MGGERLAAFEDVVVVAINYRCLSVGLKPQISMNLTLVSIIGACLLL